MRRSWTWAIVCLFVCGPLNAHESDRRKFLLDFGLGLGMSYYDVERADSYTFVDRYSGIPRDYSFTRREKRKETPMLTGEIRIGYAPTKRLEIFMDCKATSIQAPDAGGFLAFNLSLDIHTIIAVAAQYYFSDSDRSGFFGAGLGVSSYGAPTFRSLRPGIIGRIGYAFSKHLALGLDFVYEAPRSKQNRGNYVDWFGDAYENHVIIRGYNIYSVSVGLTYRAI